MRPSRRVLDFVAAINRADLSRMAGLMSEDHAFIDSDGRRIVGREAARDCWRRYFAMMPDYRISIEQSLARASTVVLVGTAAGTFSADGWLRPENHWQVPAAWRAEVTGDRVAMWQVFVNPGPIAEVIRRCDGAESGRTGGPTTVSFNNE
jgi:ketosteroid isomerase-like protein